MEPKCPFAVILAGLFEYSFGIFLIKCIVRWKRGNVGRKGGRETLNSSFSSVRGSISGELVIRSLSLNETSVDNSLLHIQNISINRTSVPVVSLDRLLG